MIPHLFPDGTADHEKSDMLLGPTGAPEQDPVNHPAHYASHRSGVECIDLAEHLSFNLGNALKYCWRAGLKVPGKLKQDLEKACWYVLREREVTLKLVISHEIIQPGSESVVRTLARKVIGKEPENSLVRKVLAEIMKTTDHGFENMVASPESGLRRIEEIIQAEIIRAALESVAEEGSNIGPLVDGVLVVTIHESDLRKE